MAEGTERPQRRCANCGAVVRVDTDYCASCKGAARAAPYTRRIINLPDIRETARRSPLLASAVVAGALVLVWMLAGSGIGLLTSALLVLGIAAILWVLVRNDRRGKDLGSRPGSRLDRARIKGPTGWELGEIGLKLDELYARKRRNKAWLGVYGLIVVVPMFALGPYAFLMIIGGVLFLPLLWWEESSLSERIAYLERRKAYLERGD